ncbi:unnamed protein product [Discosporangium mesarthrocarpum]
MRKGIDFLQTFSPVTGFHVIRTVLATATRNTWDTGLLDFTQAYLNASLEEDVWLELPDGSIVKAHWAMYGLTQSALEWYKELRGAILEVGWSSSHHDERLCYRRSDDGRIGIMMTYVDDCPFNGDYTEEMERMRTQLLGSTRTATWGTEEIGCIVIDGMGSMDVRTASSPLDPGMDLIARWNN